MSDEPLIRRQHPGPLRWIRGLVLGDGPSVEAQVDGLLGEGPAFLQEVTVLYFEFLNALTKRSDATRGEEAQILLGALFLDAVSAANTLITQGRLRAAYSQIRSMIEALSVMEYIYGDEEGAISWRTADSKQERLRFSFERIHPELKNGDEWKLWWDGCNERVHTNTGALPVQTRLRPAVGLDTHIGPFYAPTPLSLHFELALYIALLYGYHLKDWYGEDPFAPSDFETRLRRLWAGFKEYAQALRQRAEAEQSREDREPGSVPLSEQWEAGVVMGPASFNWEEPS